MTEGKKVALVTGASRGIGKAVALELAKNDYITLINYASNDAAANAVVEEIQQAGGTAKAYKCDVGNPEAVKEMTDSIIKEYKRVDVLVNNAGITRDGLFIKMSEENWENVINTNLNSAFYVTKPIARVMMKQRSGAIINLSSVCGVYGNPGQANYSAAKAGLIGFTKSLAKELAPRKVTVNAIAPGFIATDMTSDLDQEKVQASIPIGRLGEPEDIANAVMYFAESASYVTAQVLEVAGGLAF